MFAVENRADDVRGLYRESKLNDRQLFDAVQVKLTHHVNNQIGLRSELRTGAGLLCHKVNWVFPGHECLQLCPPVPKTTLSVALDRSRWAFRMVRSGHSVPGGVRFATFAEAKGMRQRVSALDSKASLCRATV